MPGLAEALRLLQAAGPTSRLLIQVRRAQSGDAAAIDYLKREGWSDALDAMRPGAGGAARNLASVVGFQGPFGDGTGPVIEGEFREVENPPWHRFLRWLVRRDWGAFVILGPKGQGKTTLALRIAEVLARETGYKAEALNLYGEDRPDWVRPISMGTLARRVAVLQLALNAQMDPDDMDAGELGLHMEIHNPAAAFERIKKRVVILDESGLAMTNSGQDSGRRLARIIMAQARHLEWIVIYIGQLAGQMPLDLLATEATFVKRPGGDESQLDRQHAMVQDLWQRAGEAFGQVRTSPWWSDFHDMRSWAYVQCPDVGGGHPYRGLMPFNRPGSDAAADAEEMAE